MGRESLIIVLTSEAMAGQASTFTVICNIA